MQQDSSSPSVNFKLLLVTILSISVLLAIALHRISIDFDVLNSLPAENPVVSDATFIFTHHPLQDRVVIDIGSEKAELTDLISIAQWVESELVASGLFEQVGLSQTEQLVPELLNSVIDNLPYLFSADELASDVAPLLSASHIDQQLRSMLEQLSGMEGVGQARWFAEDPLELRYLVLKRLAGLNPVSGAGFAKGFPVSADQQHLLVLATPRGSGTDTAQSREIQQLMEQLSNTIRQRAEAPAGDISLTAIGSYRAALDNETIVRRDTQRAIAFATIGIAILLLISFPRPCIGILSLVPAVVGTIAAFFICSLIYPSLSILAIGFGGAIISITVDHSIAYLLFLDRRETVYVKQAAEEVRAIGFIAVLTTIGAFLVLSFSGFSILAQIGQFAALGIGCSFLFVHTVLPHLVPRIPPARRKSNPWLLRGINWFTSIRSRVMVAGTILLACVLAFFAKPRFDVNLQQMNTVSEETLKAEQTISDTWGNILSRVHLLMTADSKEALLRKSDTLTLALEQSSNERFLGDTFTPSRIFPGPELSQQNLEAWREFWTRERVKTTADSIQASAEQLGFSGQAFRPFIDKLDQPEAYQPDLKPALLELLGIRQSPESDNWIVSLTLSPREGFDALRFKKELPQPLDPYLFDPALFSSELGDLLASTFLKMLLMIGIAVVVLIFLFLLDWKLTLISIIPIAFSLICTLGTLNLLNHPLDIPGLMLAIIVFGMGVDYSLFMVRSYQRYGDESHPFHGLIRLAVLLAAVSTIVGFGVLVTADHYLLHSAGLVSLLGIGFALIAAFVLLPPPLRALYIDRAEPVIRGKTRFQRTLSRYARVEAFPRMFARFKLKLDPMFSEIDAFLEQPKRVIDIGCGFGVPAAWILDQHPQARFYGLEPDPERVRVANKMLGKNGIVTRGYSPSLPETDGPVDTVLMLDMIHYLDSEALDMVFENAASMLQAGGKLIIRVTLPLKERPPWYRRIETFQIRLRKGKSYYRPLADIIKSLRKYRYKEITHQASGSDREETWIVATRGG